ncbi:MAG: MmgE/PrpD family protein, partial [Chloroflexi bacterium]|nr:MmgE/PrpD family protein [Chloroflexota bacterium]
KFHACCAINHSVMDVVLAATGGRRLRPEDVRRVEALTTSRWEAIGQREPQNQLAAKFALPFAVASALVRGSTEVASFQQAAVDDPTIRQMVDRVEVGEDPAYTAQWPEHFPARVTVDLADGTRLEAATLDPRGSAENPAEPDDLTRKFLELTAGALQPDGAKPAWAKLTTAASASDVNELTQALRAASR